jgi:hypothetical protein
MARKPHLSSPPAGPEVGYKRPPQHTRFRKGQSGNPSGKKKARPVAQEDDREAVLSQPLTMTLQGKRVTVTARRALYQRLLAMALDGNLRAMALLLKLDAQNENWKKEAEPEKPEVSESEEALITRFFDRHSEAGEGDDAQGGGNE